MTNQLFNPFNLKDLFPNMRLLNLCLIKLALLAILICSCNTSDSGLYQIDPSTFGDNAIKLTDIADDITYIPLDNSFPIAQIYPTSINILENTIYLSARDIGIIKLTRDGEMPKVIGRRGRGPGEWYYCMSIAVDPRSETVYVMDYNNEIKAYFKSGVFKGILKLPGNEDGFCFSQISIYNSNLFASQYTNMGHAKYNWIILDTLGNILSYKFNPIPTFASNMGGRGGTFKFGDKISYWDWYNDTIFTISPDLNYKASYIFSLGEGKIPLDRIPSKELFNILPKYYLTTNILETKRFLIYMYGHNKKGNLALIDKKTKKNYLTSISNEKDYGIVNNLDGGLKFLPLCYFAENGREYLVSIIDPFQLKKYINGEEFINSASEFPEKKGSLVKLVENVKETDNPILMLVRLKK